MRSLKSSPGGVRKSDSPSMSISGRGRRADVPRAEVSEEAGGDGALSWRDARAVALRQAGPSRRAFAAHRRLVRQIPGGPGHPHLRHKLALDLTNPIWHGLTMS